MFGNDVSQATPTVPKGGRLPLKITASKQCTTINENVIHWQYNESNNGAIRESYIIEQSMQVIVHMFVPCGQYV